MPMFEWGSVAAAITSIGTIITVIFMIRDNKRYREERQRSEGEFIGQLKTRLDNLDQRQDKQEELCTRERKGLWDRLDECSDGVSFLKGKANGAPH
jgi:hypothetical protein